MMTKRFNVVALLLLILGALAISGWAYAFWKPDNVRMFRDGAQTFVILPGTMVLKGVPASPCGQGGAIEPCYELQEAGQLSALASHR